MRTKTILPLGGLLNHSRAFWELAHALGATQRYARYNPTFRLLSAE